MLEQTLTGNNHVRLNPQYPVMAGVDDDRVPRIIKTDATGKIELGGAEVPKWDSFDATDHYGVTNNIRTIILSLDGQEVARWTLTYIGGGAADDDEIATGELTLPVLA